MNAMCFQSVMFGLIRATTGTEGGRRAEDPFRGLRAGPARSSPRLLPLPTLKTTPNGPYPSAEACAFALRQKQNTIKALLPDQNAVGLHKSCDQSYEVVL